MPAISLKLPDSIVTPLRAISKKKGVTQTSIIEACLTEWLKKEHESSMEWQFRAYASELRENRDLASEERFLTDSASNEGTSLLENENA